MVSVPPISVATHHLDNKLHSNSFHGSSNQSQTDKFSNLNIFEYGGSLENFQRFKHGYECTSSQIGSMETVENLHKMDAGEVSQNSTLSWSFGKKNVAPTKPLPPKPVSRGSKKGNDFDYFTVDLKLGPLEPRFGFSVSGGSDESFPARIDNISTGKSYLHFSYSCFQFHISVTVLAASVSV